MVTIVTLFICLSAGTASAAKSFAKPTPPQAPQMPGASMWIPWSDFQAILEKLSAPRPPAPDPPPPVDAVVSGALIGLGARLVHWAAIRVASK